MEKTIERIKEAEAIFDRAVSAINALEAGVEEFLAIQPEIRKLAEYYDSPQWMSDFELDGEGALPEDLKRGVLSEDGIYDLLEKNAELTEMLSGFNGDRDV